MSRARPEALIQEAVVQHLRARAPKNCFWYAVPNGGYRHPREAAAFKRAGVRAGVPDLAFLHEGRAFFLELKAPGGRSSVSQLDARSEIDAAGGFVCEAVGLDRALAVLESWGLLRS